VSRRMAALGMLGLGSVALPAVAQYARTTPGAAMVPRASAQPPRELVSADVKVVGGTIKAVNRRRLLLQASGMPSTDYTFDLTHSVVRRGGKDAATGDLVEGDTVGVLYVESPRGLIAKMILASMADPPG
jgi:hypothetical protein